MTRPILLLTAALGVTMAAGALALTVHSSPAAVAEAMAPIVAPVLPPATQTFGKSHLNVLVLGKDYDYTDKDVPYSSASRSDVIMAFRLDLEKHAISELSIPRDTAVTMPDGSVQKVNAALSAGGVREARQVISSFLGVPFDRYVVLRIDSTKQLIDAVGGVDVKVDETIDYDDNWGHLHVHVKPGRHHFNGPQAVAYARFRHDDCGDPCRIRRQQQILHAIAEKMRGDLIGDLFHARALMSVVQRNVDTDLSAREMLSLAWAFHDLDPHAVKMSQVPFSGDTILSDGGDALVADDAGKKRIVKQLFAR